MTETNAQRNARLNREIRYWRDWLKFVLWTWRRDDGMPKGYDRDTATCVAIILGADGRNGIDIFTSAEKMAGARLMSRQTFSKYRAFLVREGLFIENGENHGRRPHLDIAIPAGTGDAWARVGQGRRKPGRKDTNGRWSVAAKAQPEHVCADAWCPCGLLSEPKR